MNQSNLGKVLKIMGIILGLVIIGYLIYYFLFSRPTSPSSPQVVTSGTVTTTNTEELKKFEVPEPGVEVGENIAVPKTVSQAGPETESKLRIFDLKGENGQLLPNDFRAYQGDILSVRLTAIDKDYDFKLEGYNLSTLAKKGETKVIEFQAVNLGIYNFYCSLCQTKEKSAGRIVVVPK